MAARNVNEVAALFEDIGYFLKINEVDATVLIGGKWLTIDKAMKKYRNLQRDKNKKDRRRRDTRKRAK